MYLLRKKKVNVKVIQSLPFLCIQRYDFDQSGIEKLESMPGLAFFSCRANQKPCF